MKLNKIMLLAVSMMIISLNLSARDQIKIVGSSTVYPFSSAVAEELGETTKLPTPIVESTGSGGGMKLFCAGNDMNTPDIANTSRKMKAKEFKMCVKNGVTNITQAIFGFDGIVFAQSASNKEFHITTKQLLLAVAAEVPSKDGSKLIPNPYKTWSEIDPNLPNREIIIYGPPKSSGTRDAFEDMVLKSQTKKIDTYTKLYKQDKIKFKAYKKYKKIRNDGAYVPSGENDNLIVSKLNKNKEAFGIFGYSFLVENDDKIKGTKINGILPTPEAISNGKYPISRSLYFYIKNSHIKDVPSIKDYTKMFMSDTLIGENGILSEVGLIPLETNLRTKVRNLVNTNTKLTLEDLIKQH